MQREREKLTSGIHFISLARAHASAPRVPPARALATAFEHLPGLRVLATTPRVTRAGCQPGLRATTPSVTIPTSRGTSRGTSRVHCDTATCRTRGLPGAASERFRAVATFPGSSRVLLRLHHVLHPQTFRAAFRVAPSGITLPGIPPGFPGECEYATRLGLRTAWRGKRDGRARAGKRKRKEGGLGSNRIWADSLVGLARRQSWF